jgi:outer membrane protein assembly factor BamB
MKSMNGKVCVWRYDLSPDLCTEFYKPKGTMAGILCAEDGVLYLQDNTSVIQDKKSFFTYYLIALDAENGKVLYEKKLPEITAFYAVIRGRMLFADSTGAYFSDRNLENRERVTDGYFDQWYWDEHTNELWFSQIDPAKKTGRVYRYKDGVCEPVGLPENLYFFQLTNTKIYYTTFESVYLGNALASMGEAEPQPLYSDSGGKIFAVRRDNPDEPATVVYDTKGARVLTIKGVAGYSIFGNKLYYYDIPFIRETYNNVEYVAYSLAEDLPLLVVDLETGEEEIIRFD